MTDALGNPITQTEVEKQLDAAANVGIIGGVTSGGKMVMLSKEELRELSDRAERHFESALAHGIIKRP